MGHKIKPKKINQVLKELGYTPDVTKPLGKVSLDMHLKNKGLKKEELETFYNKLGILFTE